MFPAPTESVDRRPLRVLRLLYGGATTPISMIPSEDLRRPPPPDHDGEAFLPECAELDGDVRWLHVLARDGRLTTDAAERQINSYLFAAAYLREKRGGFPAGPGVRSLILPVVDAPHFGGLPDLGGILHGVLCRSPAASCSVATLIEQCIPCYRRVPVKRHPRPPPPAHVR